MKFILRHAWDHLQQQMRRWLTDTVSVLFRFMGDEPRPGPPGTTVRLTADFITCPEWGAQQQTESFDTRLSFTRSKDCGCCSLRGHPRSDACCRDAPNVGATTRRQAHTARKAAGESCTSSSGWCSSSCGTTLRYRIVSIHRAGAEVPARFTLRNSRRGLVGRAGSSSLPAAIRDRAVS